MVEDKFMGNRSPKVAIIDYGLGNLFSIQQACSHVGMNAEITRDLKAVTEADAVFLPGVGAFADAMASLRKLGMVDLLRELAKDGKPIIGVCLGLQLLMSESEEFGCHEGLNLIPGRVIQFQAPVWQGRILKVPQVGWNTIYKSQSCVKNCDPWAATPLENISDNSFMYFVHSFYVSPEDPSMVLTLTSYGDKEFCSCICFKNIFACQFHPERSGESGLKVYKNLVHWINCHAI